MTAIDFGLMLQPTPLNIPAEELFAYNRQLIKALAPGFTSLWAEDHLEWGETATLECLTTLAYFAAEFPRFQVGSLVMSQAYRHPSLLAKMAANLQAISGGRFVLGLGAGWKEAEYRQYGYPFPDARTRVAELEEALIVLKTLWTQRPATFHGTYYHIDGAYCEPQPAPPVPLLIGGGGEKRTLDLVARYADWYNFNSCTVAEYAHKLTVLREHCERVGRDPSEIRLTYLGTVSVAEDPAKVVRNPNKHLVAGTREAVIQELEQFVALGITHFMFRFLDIETLEYFGQAVLPHFT